MANDMIYNENNGVRWLEFELLAGLPIKHGCVMRHGGTSQGTFDSLNLSYLPDENRSHVAENRKRLQTALDLPHLCFGRLSHGVNICHMISQDPSKGEFVSDDSYDAISTDRSGHTLLITQADCQAAIFYDPIRHAVTNVHCGWRGNVQNIYRHAVEHMKGRFGSNPADLLVCISPSLGPDNAQFIHYKTELPEHFCDFQVKPLYFDLWAISEWQLKESGVLPHHIQTAKIDTYANTADYFSYRRDKTTGRQATVCALLKTC